MPEFVNDFHLMAAMGDGPVIRINTVPPKLKSIPETVSVSYYNASFQVAYWQAATVHAILIEETRSAPKSLKQAQMQLKASVVTPNAIVPSNDQIVKGVDACNTPALRKSISLTDKFGKAVISFKNLKPGSIYTLYCTATSPAPYQPIIYANEVTMLQFSTFWNPNLKGANNYQLSELINTDPVMSAMIKEYYENTKTANKKGKIPK